MFQSYFLNVNWKLLPKFLSRTSKGFSWKNVSEICSKVLGQHPRRIMISINLLCSFIEITFRHGCSPINLLKTPLEGCFWKLLTKHFSGNWERLLFSVVLLECLACFHILNFVLVYEFSTQIFSCKLREIFVNHLCKGCFWTVAAPNCLFRLIDSLSRCFL